LSWSQIGPLARLSNNNRSDGLVDCMSRKLKVAAAQMGPVSRDVPRSEVIQRLITLLRSAARDGVDLVVFPELALTTFFPRWIYEDADELEGLFDKEMPNASTQLLFDEAKNLGVGFYLGYAELVDGHRYNTAILVDAFGEIVGKYRKVHLPGHTAPERRRSHQHLEKLYFEVGDLGFPVFDAFGGKVGLAICNDRRWPETYRALALQGAELILIGYNTPTRDALSDEPPSLRRFHNHLVMQAGAYQNSLWVVASAKAGVEDEHPLMGGSAIVAPTGEIITQAETEGEELVVSEIDLARCSYYRKNIFNFSAHRRPEHYGAICAPNPGTEVSS